MQHKENKITGPDGEEYIQRKIDLKSPIKTQKQPGKRIQVYNKYRAAIQCTDCLLEPESEGSILQADMGIPFIKENVIVIR